MTAVVQPVPRNWDEVLAWFAALDPTDFANAAIGALTIAIVGLALIGLLATVRLSVRGRRG